METKYTSAPVHGSHGKRAAIHVKLLAWRLLLVSGLVLLLVSACGGPGSTPGEPVDPAVLNVEIVEGDLTLVLGSELQLTAEVSVVGGAYDGVTWASDAPSVLGVDAAGIADARSVGTARVTATSAFDESQQDTVVVRVFEVQPSLTATISAGEFHVLALSPSGEVWSWGFNEFGQLGDGTMLADVTPEVVAGLPRIVKVAAGNLHSLALTETGNVWAWGDNGGSQSGLDAILSTRTDSPNLIEGLHSVIDIAGGYSHSLALRADGTVWGWGSNWDGALGSGPTWNRHVAEPILGIEDVIQIAAGTGHSLALRADGTVWGWGNSMYGQAGVEGVDKSPIPTRIEGLADVKGITDAVAITAGAGVTFALRENGTVWAWGANGDGRLGDGGTDMTYPPVVIPGLTDVVQVDAGYMHSLAVTADGSAWTWGWNGTGGQIWEDAFDPTPVQLGLTGVTRVRAGNDHSLALLEDGTVWSWGFNRSGALGNGSFDTSIEPTKVEWLADIVQIAAGEQASLALAADGTVWVWGSNQFGQFGDGRAVFRSAPDVMIGLPNIGPF